MSATISRQMTMLGQRVYETFDPEFEPMRYIAPDHPPHRVVRGVAIASLRGNTDAFSHNGGLLTADVRRNG
jgi:hypothetical protein